MQNLTFFGTNQARRLSQGFLCSAIWTHTVIFSYQPLIKTQQSLLDSVQTGGQSPHHLGPSPPPPEGGVI